ncbi:MAG: gliding motility-associated C-terminal domain-containing protein [Saprospiraceae bacterium]
MTGLAPNQTITIGVQANGIAGCGSNAATLDCRAQNCPQVDVFIDTVAPICRMGIINPFQLTFTTNNAMGGGTPEWFGPGVDIDGNFDPMAANPGNNTINLIYTEGPCSFIASRRIRITDPPTPDFSRDSVICIRNSSLISYEGNGTINAIFSWDFDGGNNVNAATGDGPYEIQWNAPGTYTVGLQVTENNCPSDTFTANVVVEDELEKPDITCLGSNNEVIFSWDDVPGASGYAVNLLSGTSGIRNGNNYEVTGLQPNDLVTIEVVAQTSSICGPTRDTLTCEAKPCPPVNVSLGTPPAICLETTTPNVDLKTYFQLSGNTGNEVISWIGNNVDTNGIFSPVNAGPGSHRVVVRVREDGCLFSDTIQVQINRTPVARYFASPVLCLGDTLIVSFNGTAPNGSVYHWNFGNGNEWTGNTNAGPYKLTWDAAGMDSLSLWLEANGCLSDTFKTQLRIDEPLPDLTLGCTSTLDGIIFDWEAVPGATNYFWNLLDTPSYATLDPTTLSLNVGNLNPEDSITITVRAVDSMSVCPPPTITLTCATPPCPDVIFDLDPVDPICLYPNTPVVNLSSHIEVLNNLTAGTITLNGPGNAASGFFDPNLAGRGTHTIEIHYQEYSCEYDTTFEISINPLPIADAGADQRISCYDTISPIGGNANINNSPNVVYQWSGGAVSSDQTYLSTALGAGTYTLSAMDTVTGCIQTDEVVVVQGGLPPELLASVQEISCFGYNDGIIVVDTVLGGTPPFLYSFNGGDFSSQVTFANLGPGTYTIRVQDAEGCEDEIKFIVNEPNELTVELVVFANQDPIPYGDSVLLQAVTNFAPELLTSIDWTPVDQFPDCNEVNLANCLSFYVTPEGQTVYTVRIQSANGCSADDNLQLNVVKEKGIYIPSAFSPGGRDGINDIFRIYGNPKIVSQVKSFLIFDRWGELVHEAYNFEPISDDHGWDGFLKGKLMNPAVFVYFAEVEYFDGQVELFKGDVTLR